MLLVLLLLAAVLGVALLLRVLLLGRVGLLLAVALAGVLRVLLLSRAAPRPCGSRVALVLSSLVLSSRMVLLGLP